MPRPGPVPVKVGDRAGRTERPELTKLLGLITPGAHAEQSTGWDGTIAKSDDAVA